MAHEIAGDPISGLKWTRRTTERIAAELQTLDIKVCARTVARLLKQMDFALRVNHKKRCCLRCPKPSVRSDIYVLPA